ncbi:MAG TPA: hypothetical protein VIR45_13050 [Kiloniellaceae bacterium]
MSFRSFLCAAALAAFTLSLSLGSGDADAYECEDHVNRVLQEQGISQADVASTKLVRRSRGANPSSNYALDTWVRLKSCSSGALVVHMTRYCMVQDIYTTDECSVGSLPNY